MTWVRIRCSLCWRSTWVIQEKCDVHGVPPCRRLALSAPPAPFVPCSGRMAAA